MFGAAGVTGIARYVFSPGLFVLGVVGVHLQLRERRRWCSLRRSEATWVVEVGCGSRVLNVSEVSIQGAAGRVESDDKGLFALVGSHVLVYDSLARHDEPLAKAFVGMGLGHAMSTLDAICDVLAVEAKVRRAMDETAAKQ
jgi:hypothetical protein